MSEQLYEIARRLGALPADKRKLFVARLEERGIEVGVLPIVAGTRPERIPLSTAQQRLWIADQLEPDAALYNLTTTLRLRGPLDRAALQRALDGLVLRHEALRTGFLDDAGTPYQMIQPAAPFALAFVDLSRDADRERTARQLAAADAATPFVLAAAPLLRARLVALGPEDHRLILTMHHLISDEWSNTVLIGELIQLYDGAALPALAVQYADYALWQRAWLDSSAVRRQLAYWEGELGREPYELALPGQAALAPSSEGAAVTLMLPRALKDRLAQLARRADATLFMAVLAGYQIVLARTAGQDEIRVGVPIANRHRPEVDGVVGFFSNTQVLRGAVREADSSLEHLARVRRMVLEAQANQDLPFERLVDAIQPERQAGRNPLFEVMLSWHREEATSYRAAGGLTIAWEVPDEKFAKFDLCLHATDAEDGIGCELVYRTQRFSRAAIAELGARLAVVLEAMCQAPERPVAELAWLTSDERTQLARWATAEAQPAQRPMHVWIAEHAARTPDATALVGDERLTYGALEARANHLAARLLDAGVQPEDRVAIALQRSCEFVIALYAIWKCGAAYVPVDPAQPAARLQELTAGCRAIVGDGGLVPDGGESSVVVQRDVALTAAAYVMYTSGSTGKPKGVVVSHGNLASYVHGLLARLALPAGASMAMVSTVAADLGNTTLFGALCSGAPLHLISERDAFDADAMSQRMAEVDVLKIVPSHLRGLLHAARPADVLPRHTLIVGGEATDGELLAQVRALGRCRIVNHYGPTETTVGVLTHDHDGDGLPLGLPLPGRAVHVLGAALAPVPPGVVGEIYIGGAGVARGYLDQPAETAARFMPDPFGPPGARLYRTGDRARRRADGRIEFLGRGDGQIKLRGFRIELGEIRAALRAASQATAVEVLVSDGGSPQLIAYLEGDAGDAEDGVRARVAERLPAHMVPAELVWLERFPVTPNGKLDTRALAAARTVRVEPASVAPRSELEHVLARAWGEALERDAVGVHDNFFQLGGDSLLAFQVVASARAAGLSVAPRDLFEHQTVAALAAALADRAAAPAQAAIERVARGVALPASFAQERLWLLWRLEPDSAAYHAPTALRLRGELDIAALEAALRALAVRHEILRTRLIELDGVVHQVIDDAAIAIERDQPIDAFVARPFDLAAGPAWRAQLIGHGDEHVLLVVFHHVVSDGLSNAVLTRELARLYRGEAAEPLAIQYADYAAWQRTQLASELPKQLAYWQAQLGAEHPVLELPTDRARPAVASHRGASLDVGFDRALSAQLAALARAHDATPFMVLLAAFDALLYRWTGQTDLRVGVPNANRPRRELEALIGFFVNTQVLRTEVAPLESFAGLLARVKDTTLGALAHQDLPFEQLVAALAPQRSLSHTPLFQVMFNHQHRDLAALAELPGLGVELVDVEPAVAQFDLTLDTWEVDGALHGAVTYATDLFDEATVARMIAGYLEILRAVVGDAQTVVAKLPVMPADAREALMALAVGPHAAKDPRCTHELIAEQIVRTPDRVAVTCRGADLTYRMLGRRAAHLAHRLRALGVGPDALVGICLERSHDLIPSVLGVLQAGGAYLPLDPDYPRDRLAYMIGDARPAVIVTEAHLADRLPDATLCLLEPGEADAPPVQLCTPAHLAYCIYTSGSTGRPKGAIIPHEALVTHLTAMRANLRAVPDDRMLAIAPFSFDIATLELLLPLTLGARVVLAERAEALDPALLLARVRADGVTIMQGTPTTWRMATGDASAAGSLANVRTLSGGEYMPPDLAQKIVAMTGGLCNSYGPTETTIYSSSAHLHADFLEPVIGSPFANTTYYVLDAQLQPVPVGVAGELYIGGPLLARGYLERPALTAEKFLPDPFGSGGRLYRSGDVVRRRVDGELDFIRRADHQIKLRGFRIELGEIEARLLTDPDVHAAAVVLRTDGEPQLVAYVVPEHGELDIAALQAHLRAQVPEFMVPAWFVALPALPRTANGKLDVRALPAPNVADAQARYTAPRTPLEITVAAIWAEALGLERVGLDDDFFALGGHSLLAARVTARVLRELGATVPLRALFEASRLEAFAARVAGELGETVEIGAPIPLADRTQPLPLSFAQERQWFLWRLEPASAAYHLPAALMLTGALDVPALEAAFAALAQRHEVLRTHFSDDAQIIGSQTPALSIVEGTDTIAADAAQPFDLAHGPLWRARLYRVAARQHVLLVVLHHAIADEVSLHVLIDELRALYRGEALPPLAIQYADYAAWQRAWLTGDELARQLAYWTAQLGDHHPVLELPTDRARPASASGRGAAIELGLDADLIRALRTLAHERGASLFMVLLAAFDALLYRVTGQRDVRVGVPSANRSRVELERLIGFFINTHVLRAELTGGDAFTALLAQVRERVLGAQAHAELPFERLVEALRPERSLSHSPLYQVLFNHIEEPAAAELTGDLAIAPWPLAQRTAQFDLSVDTATTGDALAMTWTYATDLFDAGTIAALAASYRQLLASIAAAPDARIDQLALLDGAALAARTAWNATARDHQLDRGFAERFAAQVAQSPDRVAARCLDASLTYRELAQRARRVARLLRRRGVAVGDPVGVLAERGLEHLTFVTGILLAGGVYVALDVRHPDERVAQIVAASGARVVLDAHTDYAGDSDAPLALPSHPQQLAYVIYTSGSTGTPKGAMVTLAGMLNNQLSKVPYLQLTERDVIAQTAAPSFDISVWQMLTGLLCGAIVEIVPDDIAGDPRALLAHVQRTGITILESVPALIGEMLREPHAELALRYLLPTGEALPPELARQWLRRYPLVPLVNAYGPAECADDVALCTIATPPTDELRMPIGRPTDNNQLHVLDARLAPVPVGAIGQLAVTGVGVGHGYLNDPARTAEVFVPWPGGERVYLTGDLARHRADGTLEYVGRVDHQIKLRGQRIELGEIEARLLELPEVTGAAVALREQHLIGYVVTSADPATLRARLAELLPAAMVPSQLVALEALPLNANGKLDRAALPIPAQLAAVYTPPRTPLEHDLAHIWSEALGVAQIGRDDHFFDLGGHSLLATRITSQIERTLGIAVPLRALFEAPTLAAFARRVAASAAVATQAIVSADRTRPLPLSFTQERQWFLWRLAPESSAYHIPLVAHLRGALDRAALERAFATLAARHEALRTRFVELDGRVSQVIDAPIPAIERGDDLARVLALPFDLTRGPAWRIALHRVTDDHHVLAVVLHHIVADEVSLRVLMDELAAVYTGEALPPLALHYADYAAWQRAQPLDAQLAYWTAQLGSEHGVIELPTDRPRPPVSSGRGALHLLGLDAGLTAGLRRLARAHDATLFMVLLAAYDALLYRLTGQTDLRVGVPHANRPRAELERVIGCFINTHVLRAQLAPTGPFTALLGHVKDVALGAQAHADLPFEQLVEALQPPRSLSHNPLFQVMFNFLAGERDRSAVLPGVVMTPYDHERTTTQVDLALDVWEDGDGLAGALTYASDLFDDATAARFAGLYAELLRAVVANAATPIALLPLLPAAEHTKLTVTLAEGPHAARDPRCTHELIAEQIVRTPDRVAVTHRGADLTYRTLGRRAAHLAHRLRALGVGPDALVGICLERSHGLIPSVLGVLQAGGAYLPLDPDYPRDRLAYMIGDARPAVIVTEAHLADRLPDATLCLLEPGEADAPPVQLCTPAHLAYCIYTSGSTGRPKGALIPHEALVTHLHALREQLRAVPDDRMLAIAPFSFDIATLELLLPLTVGARVVLAERPEALDPALLLARVRADGVTIMQGTPTTWRMATGDPSAAASLASVRTLSGGEYMPPDLAQKIVAMTGGLCNSYGPTETTIYSSSAQLHAGFLDPVIGSPYANTTYYVLDAHLQPVPVGVAGELYIGGPLLARGYLERPTLTAEKFLPDPFGSGGRLYRSGDVVRRRVDGELDFIRRADHQIKLRGFRIELGEIEARLLTDPDVHAAAVVLRTDGEPQLVAYVVPEHGELDIAALQAHLRAQVPEFMVPAWFVALPALPRTANGKLDVRALPAPNVADAQARYTAPRTQLEATLAAIWADALGVDRVGLDDDFFALGGHSLLATRVAARVLRDLGKQVPLRTVFEASRLRDFAERVHGLAAASAEPIALHDRSQPAPLSYAQERQWFLWQLEPDTTAYHLPIAVTLSGAVDSAALAAAFAALTERHEALRTRFALHDGRPVQRFDAPAALDIVDGEPDLAALDAPFDLARGPLWRARLHRRADDHVLVIVMHHAISDEASLRILVDELARLYTGEALAPLALHYADHASWQRTQALDAQLAYWTKQLAGEPVVLELPTDRPRPEIASAQGATLDFALDAELTRGLVHLARAHDATLFMVLLAAFDALLYRLTGQRDLRVGVPATNRSRVELERVIGFFVNTHVLRTEVAPEASFSALLGQVREAALAAQAHPDVPFEQLVEALRPPRSLSHNPIFQVMFNHLWQDRAQAIELPGLTLAPLTLPRTTTQVDLQLTTWEDGDAVRGAVTYATALFDAASIERMIAQLTQLLRTVVATPALIVARLPVIAAPALLGPVEPLDARSLPARIAAQIAATPDAIAVRTERTLTYRALGRRAAALAAQLRARGVGPDTLVGLCVERTHDLVIGALGILLAGGAYVPLDPDYPRERIADMLADARPDVIVTDDADAFGAHACLISDAEADLALPALHPQHLAYCIYTSGSTGRPKGVAIPHAAIGNFLDAMLRELPITHADRILAITPISFDIAGLELWLPLVTGATIVLADRATALIPAALLARIRDAQVTVVQATPSTWRMIATHPDAEALRGRRLLCGGEALPADLAAQLVRLSDTWNVYGPTETTVWSAIAKVADDVVLGAPLRNTTLALRDAHQQPVPHGTPAELYIGGDGLARGYWNRPDLTADRFVPAPGGARLYRTGDRVRQTDALAFLGRVDHQIKLRGHRIELGEIEARLLEQPGVRAAAVVLRDDRGDPRIVGYVVGDRDAAELLTALRAALPAYMVPAQLVALDALPRSPAGKLDRKALPAPDAPARTLVPPRDDLERRLVALWQDVLAIGDVGIHDGFFDLGGHSLSATRLASRIREDLALELPLRVLFEATTVAELADAIRAGGFGAISDAEVDDMSAMLDQLESP